MYKWPIELQPSEFRGLVVEAITFTINTITISFGKDCFITVESSLHLKTDDEEEEIPVPASNTDIISLLGKSVRESNLDTDGASLLLTFDEGYRLRLDGDDEQYECFHVNVNGKEFAV